MARAALKWSREDLAKKSGVAAVTIKGFELLGADSKFSTLNKLQRALEAAGVEFIDEGHKSDDGGPGAIQAQGEEAVRPGHERRRVGGAGAGSQAA